MALTISRKDLTEQLLTLGVKPGGVLLVHTAFSKVAPVEDGPRGLIAALLDALGPGGTLAMPSMSDDDDHPFDAAATSCIGMGVVAETFWKLPGVARSDSPHAFAAIGPQAAAITAPHPIDIPHGLDSPVGRIYERDGQVLLLGIGHDANTTVHLAESVAGVRYRRPKHAMILRDGRITRCDYGEIDHCCDNFKFMDEWLDATGRQRRGKIGHGDARLANSRDIVEVAVGRLRADETVFLHPYGFDNQCDEARDSLPDREV
jgi:aminoglycoside N3'-acetyltransferase